MLTELQKKFDLATIANVKSVIEARSRGIDVVITGPPELVKLYKAISKSAAEAESTKTRTPGALAPGATKLMRNNSSRAPKKAQRRRAK